MFLDVFLFLAYMVIERLEHFTVFIALYCTNTLTSSLCPALSVYIGFDLLLFFTLWNSSRASWANSECSCGPVSRTLIKWPGRDRIFSLCFPLPPFSSLSFPISISLLPVSSVCITMSSGLLGTSDELGYGAELITGKRSIQLSHHPVLPHSHQYKRLE